MIAFFFPLPILVFYVPNTKACPLLEINVCKRIFLKNLIIEHTIPRGHPITFLHYRI